MGNEDTSMSVTELRKELATLNLDTDGSKAALIARLDEAKRQERD